MLRWALIFFFDCGNRCGRDGVRGNYGGCREIAISVLFYLFLILFLVSLIGGLARRT